LGKAVLNGQRGDIATVPEFSRKFRLPAMGGMTGIADKMQDREEHLQAFAS
jgi:hypothetical protein